MSEMWKKWEGQVVDHKYQLQRYVGSTDHSVVFQAECHDSEPHQIAIKFVSAEVAGKEQQLANWKTASQLSHPDLLKVYGSGQCRIEDTDLLYVVMEYAEENLSQVLPHRALVTEETREMLNAISSVLVYLHENNLVHGHIKPSNILASGETLKLSSDTISPAGEVHEMRRERSGYDAPELPGSPYTPAADVWSLGVTLVETLTQQPAFLPFNEQADPIVPGEMREPFQEIARQTLRRDPRRRWSSEQIAEKVHPTPAVAKSVAAGAGTTTRAVASSTGPVAVSTEPPPPAMTSALNVPLSRERAAPLAKQEAAPPVRRAAPRASSSKEEGLQPRETVALPSYVIPVFAGLLVVIALIVLPFALRHRGPAQASSVSPASTASSSSPAASPNANGAAAQPTLEVAPANANAAPEKSAPVAAPHPQPVTPATATGAAGGAKDMAPSAPKTFSRSNGEALDQVRPEVPGHALNTIHGTVRVRVKVHADPAGNVSSAVLDNAGPSHYFADLSLKAAKQWVFTPPEVDGHSVPSDWMIQFHYTSGGVQMSYEPLGTH
jgi:hypothetical protein